MNTVRLIVSVVVSFVVASLAAGQAAGERAVPRVGELSPALGIEELMNAPEGAEATLGSLRGKVVVLEFWATWCGPCVMSIPHLNELREAFLDEDIVFISVTKEPREVVERFQKRGRPKIDGWIGIDTDGSLSKAYGVRYIPHTVILDGYGRVASITDPRQLDEERIRGFLSGHRDMGAEDGADVGAERPAPVVSSMTVVEQLRRVQDDVLFHMYLGVNPLGDEAMQSGQITRGSRSFTGMSRLSLLANLLGTDQMLIEFDGVADDERRYDLAFGREGGIEDEDQATVRARVLETLGLEVREDEREFGGYRLVQIESGHRLEEIEDTPQSTKTGRKLEVTSGTAAPIVYWAQTVAGVPVDDATNLNKQYTYELGPVEPWTLEAMRKVLRDQAGLDLVPAKVTRTVMVVSPRSKDRAAAD